jgi:hypothetical protein
LLSPLHSFRYAAGVRALRCLLLEAHRLVSGLFAVSCPTIGLREPRESRRRAAPPTFL